jgi:L-ribulose-5-phosphate 4-epimerase
VAKQKNENKMLEELKKTVCQANLDLVRYGLVIFTWGNVSGIDRDNGWVVIKPSGTSYDDLNADDMVVLDLDGKPVEGKLKPSSDTPTHLHLYRKFDGIGGIVHTHSEWATSWAQARRPIPAYGTTHADYFYGAIPCTRPLTEAEVVVEYEHNTGVVIAEAFSDIDPMAVPGVLVGQHGPFAWGKNPHEAVHNAKVMEEVAKMAFRNETLGNTKAIDPYLLDKHYMRKHGNDAYYGQINKSYDEER